MFGLEERHINFIKSVLRRHIKDPGAEVYIFGSRAKGRYKEYSDVDIAVNSKNFTSSDKTRLELEFENSTFPYEIDIIDLNNIQESFKNLIKDDLISLKI